MHYILIFEFVFIISRYKIYKIGHVNPAIPDYSNIEEEEEEEEEEGDQSNLPEI